MLARVVLRGKLLRTRSPGEEKPMATINSVLRITSILGICAAMAACKGGSEVQVNPQDVDGGADTGAAGGAGGGGGTDAGADTGVASSSRSIGPEGGQVSSAMGASVTVPADALAAPVTISVAVVGQGDAMPSLPAAVTPAGSAVELTPHGQAFQIP